MYNIHKCSSSSFPSFASSLPYVLLHWHFYLLLLNKFSLSSTYPLRETFTTTLLVIFVSSSASSPLSDVDGSNSLGDSGTLLQLVILVGEVTSKDPITLISSVKVNLTLDSSF